MKQTKKNKKKKRKEDKKKKKTMQIKKLYLHKRKAIIKYYLA